MRILATTQSYLQCLHGTGVLKSLDSTRFSLVDFILGKPWDEIVTCAGGYAVIASAATSSRWDEMLTKIESLPRLPFVFPMPKPSIQISVKVSMLLSSIVRTVGRVK
ncbi:hypothetical protein Psta_1218 [Pirellula staleyi DSM 6068]|uniref:Uncharacterized protein n=1 Tax=Pirellula staleyi (strain ATCC 27377 / DSM 6068 / ICPB 4128) TaxID=530564 RepID=D2R969_PIRSD|nr:hypothetical protein Psta_1218 [Pirellula staleyi DSM 6068]